MTEKVCSHKPKDLKGRNALLQELLAIPSVNAERTAHDLLCIVNNLQNSIGNTNKAVCVYEYNNDFLSTDSSLSIDGKHFDKLDNININCLKQTKLINRLSEVNKEKTLRYAKPECTNNSPDRAIQVSQTELLIFPIRCRPSVIRS